MTGVISEMPSQVELEIFKLDSVFRDIRFVNQKKFYFLHPFLSQATDRGPTNNPRLLKQLFFVKPGWSWEPTVVSKSNVYVNRGVNPGTGWFSHWHPSLHNSLAC